MQQIKVGDIVYHVDGGGGMTVNSIYQHIDKKLWCECVWFSTAIFQEIRSNFPASLLKKTPNILEDCDDEEYAL